MKPTLFAAALLLVAGCATDGSVNATAQATAPHGDAAPESQDATTNFRAWVSDFRADAAEAGIPDDTLSMALDGAELQPRVLELDARQPEFTRQIWEYLDVAVSDQRIATGRQRLDEHMQAAADAAREYGVRREILVAIWGLESNYGGNLGDYAIIDALATLGYDGRRQDFARRELMAALRILEQDDIARQRMRGSWAGAMGHTQFLPSSFLAYAVDADGDDRRDIWDSIPDVLASTANYLDQAGWQSGQPWGLEVKLPEDFDYALANSSERRPATEWAAMGVTPVRGDRLPAFGSAAVLTPAGANGPAFLVGPNFRAIMAYNNATSYALAVAHLADRIEGAPAFRGDWPRGLAALSRDQIEAMQKRLNARGFDAGSPDGIAGPNTRSALRAFQREEGLVPDGFPTFALLERLRRERQ